MSSAQRPTARNSVFLNAHEWTRRFDEKPIDDSEIGYSLHLDDCCFHDQYDGNDAAHANLQVLPSAIRFHAADNHGYLSQLRTGRAGRLVDCR
jgi:hypothetical protein